MSKRYFVKLTIYIVLFSDTKERCQGQRRCKEGCNSPWGNPNRVFYL